VHDGLAVGRVAGTGEDGSGVRDLRWDVAGDVLQDRADRGALPFGALVRDVLLAEDMQREHGHAHGHGDECCEDAVDDVADLREFCADRVSDHGRACA